MKNAAKLVSAKGNICLVDGNDMMVNLTLIEFFADMFDKEFDLKSNDVSAITRPHSISNDDHFPFHPNTISGGQWFKDNDLEERNPCKPYTRKQFLTLLYLITVASTLEQQESIAGKSFHFIVQHENGWKVCINLVLNGWPHCSGNWYIRAFKEFNYAGNERRDSNREHVHVFIPTGQQMLGQTEENGNTEFMTLLIAAPAPDTTALAIAGPTTSTAVAVVE